MSWDPNRFESLVSRMFLTLEGKRPIMDSNIYLFRYPAEMEFRCISECTRLAKRLESKKLGCEIIWINVLLMDVLRKIDTIEALSKVEKKDRNLIFNDLSDVTRGVTFLLANEISNILKDKQMSHCAILLRIASALPFVNISAVLSLLENRIKCLLVLACPENNGKIIGTGQASANIYPRGEVV